MSRNSAKIMSPTCIFLLDNECPPGIDENLAFTETANKQYRYETQAKLDETLQQQYGQVYIW